MKDEYYGISPTTGADESLGSVSLLSFLLEESTSEVYRDPIKAMYGSEPLRTKQSLADIYTVESVEEDLLRVKKNGRYFRIANSFDISFSRLVGAAMVMASYSTIPDFDLRGGEHAAYSTKNALIPLNRPQESFAPSRYTKVILDFWNSFDPEYELIREIKVYLNRELAEQLLDFDAISEAMDTGAITSRADSVLDLSPKLESLETIDAINSPEELNNSLQLLCGAFGADLPHLREKVRLSFTKGTRYSNLVPSDLADPLIESLLANLFTLTPDDCEKNSGATWYTPGEFDIYDVYITNDEELEQYDEENSISSINYEFLEGEFDTGESATKSLPDRIPVPPSLILAGAYDVQKHSLAISYAETTTVEAIATGTTAWIDDESIIEIINVVYDTAGKIARQRHCDFDDEIEYSTDEYVANRLPVKSEKARNLVSVSEITTEEADRQIGSITPGKVKNELRVGSGYIWISLSTPAELVCQYVV
ncbi:hypothetical protein [Halobellus ruber]|uniref:Uncharacterized protein n=1 Tax=Halobellus ruber TaxID=2761102 RepID=A0A7J9SLL8_9EURY|nr:hypothetical protein [Halobellus ruber]MBB6645921.1 hypothetical protein [Halobellus ruber]